MDIALIALGIVCGLLGVALGVVGITLWHFINNRPFRYIYDDVQGKAVKRLEAELSELRQKNRELEMQKQKPEPPKPDPAKECGVVKPFFSDKSPLFRKTEIKAEPKPKTEQPRRMGMHKVRIYLYDVPAPKTLLFHNLAEFYRFAEVRKCDFSPSVKMEENVRLSMIAARIVFFYRERGLTVRAVSLYRKKRWHAFEYDEKGFRK